MSYTDCKHFDPSLGIWVIAKKAVYEKTESGKSWRKGPIETEISIETPYFYRNYVKDSAFFGSRDYWGITPCGYLPTRITTVSPYDGTKTIMQFEPFPAEIMRRTSRAITDRILYSPLIGAYSDGTRYLFTITEQITRDGKTENAQITYIFNWNKYKFVSNRDAVIAAMQISKAKN